MITLEETKLKVNKKSIFIFSNSCENIKQIYCRVIHTQNYYKII